MRLSSFLAFFLLFISAASAQVIGVDRASKLAGVTAPVVSARTVNLSVPVALSALGVITGSSYVSNGPTGCTITAGNSAGNYSIANDCTITVSNPTGVNNLTAIGTDVLTVQATNASPTVGTGQVTINKWTDGATASACATPQYPSLLTGLATRAPWKVAGVDYCVGPATGTTFKVPGVNALPTGTTLTGSTVLVNNANTALDGWNFTGFTLDINASNVTVTNSVFKSTTGAQLLRLENTATFFTFNYNDMDGAGSLASSGSLITSPCTSIYQVFQWNWVRNAPQDLFNFCTGIAIVQFNIIENGGVTQTGGNFLQNNMLAGQSITEVVNFNLGYQHNGRPTSGLAFTPNIGTFTGTNCIDFNTVVASGAATVLNDGVGPSSNSGFTIPGTLQARNNYGAYLGTATGTFLHCDTATFTSYVNNVNMVNNTQFTVAACPPPQPQMNIATFNLSFPVANGTTIGTVTAQNNPQHFQIVSCATISCTAYNTPADNGTWTVANGSLFLANTTYTVQMTASNTSGTSQPATQTINVGGQVVGTPTITPDTFTISTPAVAGDFVGTVRASNNPTSYNRISCSPGCNIDWFAINNANGNITLTAAGAAGMPGTADKQTVALTLNATNGNGTGPNANETVNGYADGFKNAPNCSTTTTAFTGPPANTLIAQVSGQGYPPAPFQALAKADGGVVAAGGSPMTFGVASFGGSAIIIQRIVNPGQYTTAPPNTTTISIVSDPTIPAGFNAQKATISVTYTQTSTTVANIQFPNLLDSYGNNRPPWKVAGVDYCLGPPSNQVFKIPGVDAAPSCVNVDAGNHLFTITANNCVINGWDFTVGPGWGIECGNPSSNDPVITNNKFKYNSGSFTRALSCFGDFNGVTGIGLTFKNNSVDDNYFNDEQTLWIARGGTVVIEYNVVQHTVCDWVKQQAEVPPVQTHVTVKWNAWNQDAAHDASEGCHGDMLQTFGETPPTTDYTSLIYNFNLIIETPPVSGTDGVILQCNGYPNCTVGTSEFNYNTGIFNCNIAGCVNEWVRIGGDNVPTAIAHVWENYAAPHQNINSVFQLFDPQAGVAANFQNNKNMITGGNCRNQGSPC